MRSASSARWTVASRRHGDVQAFTSLDATAHDIRAAYHEKNIDGGVVNIPDEITAQLANGGRLTAVCADDDGTGRAVLMERRGGAIARRTLFDAAIPTLKEFNKTAGFVF